jgi:hypothetical protein
MKLTETQPSKFAMVVVKIQIVAGGHTYFSLPLYTFNMLLSISLTGFLIHFCFLRSVFVLFWSAFDHLTYMGIDIAADDWSTCRIVLGRSVERLQMDLASNIVLSSNSSVDLVIADDPR